MEVLFRHGQRIEIAIMLNVDQVNRGKYYSQN